MSFPRYESYKESGVDSLGEAPSHWTTVRLKAVAAIEMGQSPASEQCSPDGMGLPFLQGCAEFGSVHPSPKAYCEEPPKSALAGDTLLSVRAPVGVMNTADRAYGIGRGLCAIRARSLNSRFMQYALEVGRSQLHAVATGSTYAAVSVADVEQLSLLIPCLEEQQEIAAFLDGETAKIDALVEAQQRLIELLKEKRQAVISHAVTKGLDPSAPMKESGVEWLGRVPAHWELKRLSRACQFQSGKAHEPFIDEDGDYIYVSARFVSTNGHSVRYCTENFCPTAVGDILMVMSDLPNGRALARAFLVKEEAPYAVNQRVCRIRPTHDDPRFLAYQLDRNIGLLQHDDGLNQTHLSNGDFESVLLAIPPITEQLAISTYVCRMIAEMDRLTAAAESAISLLVERRAALISAAVTGKIDVRGLAVAPQEAEAEAA